MITPEDIRALLSSRASESKVLEFKSQLPGNDESAQVKLCKTVSAFANTAGGSIIYGVVEDGGRASHIRHLECKDLDSEILRIEGILNRGIDPPVLAITPKRLSVDNTELLVIEVSQSWTGCHFVVKGDNFSMYRRTNSGNHPLGIADILDRVRNQDIAAIFVRQWLNDRITAIASGQCPLSSVVSPVVAVFLAPLSMYSKPYRHAPEEASALGDCFKPLVRPTFSKRSNVDGWLACANRSTGPWQSEYVQVFRSGAIESASLDVFQRNSENGRSYLPSSYIDRFIITSIERYAKGVFQMGCESPVVITVSFIRADDVEIATGHHEPLKLDRRIATIPEFIISSLSDMTQQVEMIRKGVWNAFGAEGPLPSE